MEKVWSIAHNICVRLRTPETEMTTSPLAVDCERSRVGLDICTITYILV